MVIADVDDDGTLDLVLAGLPNNYQASKLYVYQADGDLLPGFPINGEITRTGDPVVFDSDDDGKLEIVAAWQGLHLFASDGTTIWYHPYSGPIFQSTYRPYHASIDDLDNDGKPEIVVTCYSGGAIFVFDAQGNVKPGWPMLAPMTNHQSASIGDIDHDGQKEIIVTAGNIWCLKPDGSLCPAFPIDFFSSSRSKAVLADIEGDGYLEIIFGWLDPYLRILRYDGTMMPGYPIAQRASDIAFGDINRDGSCDITMGWYSLYSYDVASASPLPFFPITDTADGYSFSAATLNLVDLSDTPGLEIAVGAGKGDIPQDGRLYTYDVAGQLIAGFPSATLYHRSLSEGCSLNDVDGNGTTDICCGSYNGEYSTSAQSTVYCWDSGYPYNLDNVDWAMDGFDLGHTGRWRRLYHISKAGSQLAVGSCQGQGNPCYLPPDGSLIPVDVMAIREHGGANPAGQDVRYSRTLGCANYEGPVVDHGDGTYSRMLRAPTADCTTDLHAWVNEFKLQDHQQIVFTNSCFQPPATFNLSAPANKDSNQPLTVTLSWQAVGSFPNAPTGYDLYFGPTSNPPLYASNIAGTQFTVSGLTMKTTYFWKVVAKNACGATSSPLWAFTTIPCTIAPRPFSNLSPPNGAVNQPLTVDLTWQASTQAAGYEVYLGPTPSSLALVSTVGGTRYTAGGLCASTTYYWEIVAVNSCGRREGTVWTFTTGADDEPHHPRPVSPP
jgi:hypothetical protein